MIAVYLDVEDFEFPFGLNLFEAEAQYKTQAAVASFVSHTFETLWQNRGLLTKRKKSYAKASPRLTYVSVWAPPYPGVRRYLKVLSE